MQTDKEGIPKGTMITIGLTSLLLVILIISHKKNYVMPGMMFTVYINSYNGAWISQSEN